MSIRYKILGSFGIVLSALIVLVAIAVYSLLSVHSEVEHVIEDYQPLVVQSAHLSTELEKAAAGMGFYLLSKDERYRRNYESSLAASAKLVEELKQSPIVQQDKISRDLVNSIDTDFHKFHSYRDQMIELAQDESKNLTAMAYANENINPLTRQISQILSQMVAAEEDAEVSTTRKRILLELTKLRYTWSSLMNEMRLYLAFRAPAGRDNIALYQSSLDASVNRLDDMESNFEFEQQDGYEQFKSLRTRFNKNLAELLKLHGSDKWRTDAYLLKTEIGPALVAASTRADELVSLYQHLSETAENSVAATASFGQRFLLLAALCVGVVVVLFALFLYRSIAGPLATAMMAAKRIADDDLSVEIEAQSSDEAGQLLTALSGMQRQLRSRIESEREAAADTARIKNALDTANANVMVADADMNIVYMNKALESMFRTAEADLKTVLPKFDTNRIVGSNMDIFHAHPEHQRKLIDSLTENYTTRLEVGGRYIDLSVTPVFDQDGNRAGTTVEWADQTNAVLAAEEEKRKLEEERRQAVRNQRIKQALDGVESCVMVARSDHSIVYMNNSMDADLRKAEAAIQRVVPAFKVDSIEGMHIDRWLSLLCQKEVNVSDSPASQSGEIQIENLVFAYKATPVYENDERSGTVLEWQDKTEMVAIEREIEEIVNAVQAGDLEKRVDESNKEGFYLQLGVGMNTFIDVVAKLFYEIAQVMEAMSVGDMTRQMQGEYSGLFATVKDDINKTVHDIRQIIEDIARSTDVIYTSSGEISSGNNNLSQRTEQQAANLEETAASVEELTATVEHNADNTQQASQLAVSARDVAEKGQNTVSEAVMAMGEISASSNKIAEIIGVIDDIAFQTNLLALNASVEAARAGDQGRGFAVVASEVRNLAQRSAASAKEIKDLIQDSVAKVSAGTDLVNESGEQLLEIVTGVKKVGDIIAEIAAASREQSLGIHQVNQAVQEMDEITQQNAALAEQTSAASVSMSEQATEMKNLLGFFMLSEEAGSQSAAVQPGADRRAASRPWGGGAKRVNTVDFASARSKHLAWKTRLRNFLDGKEALTQSQAVSHRDCDLGKWLYSEGMDKYGHIGEMQKLEQLHKEMHGLIIDIIQQQEAGNSDQAETFYSQVTTLSGQIVDLLTAVEKQVKSGAGAGGQQKAVAVNSSSAAISHSDDWEEF